MDWSGTPRLRMKQAPGQNALSEVNGVSQRQLANLSISQQRLEDEHINPPYITALEELSSSVESTDDPHGIFSVRTMILTLMTMDVDASEGSPTLDSSSHGYGGCSLTLGERERAALKEALFGGCCMLTISAVRCELEPGCAERQLLTALRLITTEVEGKHHNRAMNDRLDVSLEAQIPISSSVYSGSSQLYEFFHDNCLLDPAAAELSSVLFDLKDDNTHQLLFHTLLISK
eukprot:1436434-Pyramimonas_sp.AAC.2